jgi:transposase
MIKTMAGVTSTVVKESAEELTQRIKEATTAREKDKLQVLYWLKQEKALAIKVIAKSLGHHRNTVQTWLSKYREKGLEGMLERKKSKGRVRVIPEWAD